MQKELGDSATNEQLVEFIWSTLKKGQVIPVSSDIFSNFSFFMLITLFFSSGLRSRRSP